MVRKKRNKSYPRPKFRKQMKKKKKRMKRQTPLKQERKTTSVINVKNLMKKHAGGMLISPSAVHAMIDRIDLFLEISMPQIAEIAMAHGCKTIKEFENHDFPEKSQAHITWFFSITKNKIENTPQLKKKYHWELVKNGKNKKENTLQKR